MPFLGRNNVDNPRISGGNAFDKLCRSIGRIVVDHDDIELETGFLRQCRANGVADCLMSVPDGNNNRCLDPKISLVEINRVESRSVDKSTNFIKMLGDSLFKFYLNRAITRIYIVELTFPAAPCGFKVVKGLGNMDDASLPRGGEHKPINIDARRTFGKFSEKRTVGSDQRPEIEIIAQSAFCAVD